MTKEQRQESLINARRACLMLIEYAIGVNMLILGEPQREAIASLIEEFGRLDGKERRQIEAGKLGAKHGEKGGRPTKKKPAKTGKLAGKLIH